MIVIGNGKVVTRDSKNPFIENGAVAVDGKVIKKIGTLTEIKNEFPKAEFVDAKGGYIMPAFINMHNHIYSAFARGMSINGYSPKGFLDILDGLWWKLDRTMNLKDCYRSAQATYLDCIRNGVTTVFDHHASFGAIDGSLNELAKAAQESSLRSCLCYEVSDRDGKAKADAAVAENETFIKRCKEENNPLLSGMVGMHASFTIGNETMEKCAEISKKYNAGCHIHVAEGLDDVTDCLSKYGKRLINRLQDMEILGSKTMTIHCIHIDSEEMEIVKATNTMVVHNPESNMGNAVGCVNVPEMYKRGLTLGLGTDGYTNDMIESYKVANIIHKHTSGDPNAAWAEIPVMLFENNAKMANRFFEPQLGVLKEGAAADVIVAEYDPLTPLNASNVNGHILFGMNGRNVVTTMCAGKILMKDRIFTELDEQSIMAHAREQSADLWKRINS